MRIISFTDARNGLKAVLDTVVNDADTTVITRRDSADAVVPRLLQQPDGNRSFTQITQKCISLKQIH
jgi:hypothetical protein